MTTKQIRNLREAKMKELKQKLCQSSSHCDLKTESYYFSSLSTLAAHSGHSVGTEAAFFQKVNPCVSQKISELVNEGMLNYNEMKKSLVHYVKHVLPVVEGIDPQVKTTGNFILLAKKACQL